MKKKYVALFLALTVMLSLAGCVWRRPVNDVISDPTPAPTATPSPTPEPTPVPVVKNGDVMILYTGDVHCAADKGFGYAGLRQVRDAFEAKGYDTLLADVGDAVHGTALGDMDRGQTVIELMNAVGYDMAIPGNHEFAFGVDRFLELAETAEFPYISCNFNREGELLFAPCVIKEAAGKKIAFVGVSTPRSVTGANAGLFQNESGELVYGFCQNGDGEELYSAVQSAVDSARAAVADYVVILGHLGNQATSSPWSSLDVIGHTTGVDAFLDGHSHDDKQMTVYNAVGQEVLRGASGTRLRNIGYLLITADGRISTGLHAWAADMSAPELFGIDNEVSKLVAEAMDRLAASRAAPAEADGASGA